MSSLAFKRQRADQMLEDYLDGMSVAEIAARHDVLERTVYVRLNDLGVDFKVERPSDLWSMGDDQRRAEITKRASRGASEALKAFRSKSPLSTVFTAEGQIPLTDCK